MLYLGVFVSAFGAATLLPVASEVVLLAALTTGDPLLLWAVASAGNTLGAMVNWLLGRSALHWQDRRWFPATPEQLDRGQAWFERWGSWTLLLAWVPLIGDALTVVAGVLRVRLWLFVILVFVGKAGRYAVLIGVAQQ